MDLPSEIHVSCHCGNVQVAAAMPAQVTQCNCSICARYQALWAYYPSADVRINVGNKGLHSYSWGKKHIAYVRCAHCGCVTHYENTPSSPKFGRVAINTSMSNVDISSIPVRHFDGATEY